MPRLRVLTGAGLLVGWLTAIGAAQSPAGSSYRNLQVLKGMPAAEVDAVMKVFNRALGVDCVHCHVPDQWHEEAKPAFATARNMFRMVQQLNANQLSTTDGVTCWTCHAGQARPSRLPGAQLDAELAKWPADLAKADDGVKLGMVVYNISLGVGCDHCHTPRDWKAATKPPYRMVATMTAMFEVFPKFMPKTARTQCYMCHKGAKSPRRE